MVGEVPGTAELVGLKYRTPWLERGQFWRVSYIGGLQDGVGPGVDAFFGCGIMTTWTSINRLLRQRGKLAIYENALEGAARKGR